MKILALDSSAKTASAAIIKDKKLIAEFFVNAGLTHSQTLALLVDSVIKSVNITPEEINCFAVSSGPGSFTGIRIGIALVKGIAFAVNKPCVGVSTLEAIAYNHIEKNAFICSVMDARCNQVYNANFVSNNGKMERLCDDRAILIEDLKHELLNVSNKYDKIILTGDGAEPCYTYMPDIKEIILADNIKRFQRASSVGFLALKELNQNNTVNAEELVPFYLRLPQAERELNNKLKLIKGE